MTTPTEDEARAAVWDDAQIREAFIYDGGESAYHDPINGEKEQRRIAGEIFDRWLEAHDAALASRVSTPPSAEGGGFCDQCGGPYEGWLTDQYGGHWDTCPNRLTTPATPPTGEDEREAAIADVTAEIANRVGVQRLSVDLVRGIVNEWERRRQAVSTPEPEWEYGPAHADDPAAAHALANEEIARREVDGWNASRRRTLKREGRDIGESILVRRRKAGPWEPVPTEGEA